MNAISINDLTKTFGRPGRQVKALDNTSFDVREGSITAFLGPNGAGKSTTMNILLGFINATSGSVKIFDQDVTVNTVDTRRQLGFLSNNFALDATLTVSQELRFLGNLAGSYDENYSRELAKRLDLGWDAKISSLSTGNYQKVALISALQHRPKLLVLDEPTNGLDPLVQAEFNQMIRELHASGSTVFISSHILSEVSELCDEFIFIKRGRIVAQMTKKEIDAQSGQVLTIKPTAKNRAKVLNFLNDNDVDYSVGTGDLEQTFMEFYDHDLVEKPRSGRA